MTRENNGTIRRVLTNEEGLYVMMSFVQAGLHTLEVAAEGFISVTDDGVGVNKVDASKGNAFDTRAIF